MKSKIPLKFGFSFEIRRPRFAKNASKTEIVAGAFTEDWLASSGELIEMIVT